MSRGLAFGLSGVLGEALRARGLAGEWTAVSRRPQAAEPGLAWRVGDLSPAFSAPGPWDAVVSLGPLDGFARWFAAQDLTAGRVVAIGSTSVSAKRDSPDPGERALASRLAEAEEHLATACAARGAALTVLRPTLVYGRARDQNLSRLVRLARRWRCLPLPSNARGLRQPVHADDVAAAVTACLAAPVPVRGGFDLPGGEALPYDAMVARTLAAARPGTLLLRVPPPLFRAGLRTVRALGLLPGAGDGLLARLDRDLVFDAGPAAAAFGYAPRAFCPTPGMFPSD